MANFNDIYILALNHQATALQILKNNGNNIDIFQKRSRYLTAAGKLASENNGEALKILRDLGAKEKYIAYGYALAGNHLALKEFKHHDKFDLYDFITEGLILEGYDRRALDFIKNHDQHYERFANALIAFAKKGEIGFLKKAIEIFSSKIRLEVIKDYSNEIFQTLYRYGHKDAALEFHHYRMKYLSGNIPTQSDQNTQSENNHNNALTFKKSILKKATESSYQL